MCKYSDTQRALGALTAAEYDLTQAINGLLGTPDSSLNESIEALIKARVKVRGDIVDQLKVLRPARTVFIREQKQKAALPAVVGEVDLAA